jgi:hypothetical protein
MTGAVKAIEKIKKGLSDHPQVAAVLKRQNEKLDQEDEPFVKDLVKKLRKGSATHGKQADDLEKALDEDGHTDVASAKNQVKVAMSAMNKMNTELSKLNDEDSLPSWWTNKVAVAVDKLDGMADYLDTQVEEVDLDERDKKSRYVRPMDRKFSDTAKSNIQINQEVQALYDRIMGKTGIKYKREFMRGVPGRKNKQTHVIVVNKKDKNAANKAVKNYNFSPIEKEVFVKKGHFVVFAVDNLDDRASWYKEETVVESWELDEGKMKQFHMMQNDGKSAEEIAKALKLDLKTVKALMKEEVELEEGTWAVPETPAQKRDLKKLLKSPLKLGKEGDNAADKMYSIIGDDELFDDLYVAGNKDPEGDARPIIKKAMKRLKIKEDRWFDRDSWRLDESTKPDHIKIFNSLKKGDKVEINYDSSIAAGSTKTFVIKTKNKVYKGRVDKVTMYPDGKTGGVKFHLYQYDNRPGVYMAIGDMGASLRDIKKL